MDIEYKLALQVLMFDCEKTILRMLDNCGPYVDKIYVITVRFFGLIIKCKERI